jgi:hypothetical protein
VRVPLTAALVALLVISASGQQHTLSAALLPSSSVPELTSDLDEAHAVDEMLRGVGGRQRRWNEPPHLVVVRSVLQFDGAPQNEYAAVAESLAPGEAEEMAVHLSLALDVLTGHRFVTFAGIQYEDVGPGTRVSVVRHGDIVVARFRGVLEALDAVGYGGRTTRQDGTITSGVVMLDSDYDRTNPLRRLLRMHELGHALGYNHVESRQSIMNPTLGSEPTEFDRRVALLAFSR